MKRCKWEIPLNDGDEYNYLTRARHGYHHKPGQIPAVKRKYRKRVREFEKTLIADELAAVGSC